MPKVKSNQYQQVTLPPKLQAYLNRIEATAINFRRYIVREESDDGYPQTKCIINLLPDGSLHASKPDYAPTEDEAKDIAKEVKKEGAFPKSIDADQKSYDAYVKSFKTKPNMYPIYGRKKKGQVLCAQQRIENEDGSKSYIIHTLFSDGKWYKLEPDGPLPFYKPEKAVSKKLMVHEGAKAAMAAAKFANDPKHPWHKELAEFEHWGTLGGAKRTPEMDYEEIERANPDEVVYVCDNDNVGVAAGRDFSKHLGETRKLFMVRFEVKFPVHFDMADELPAEFTKSKIYSGPTIRDLSSPATYATKKIMTPEGKEVYVLREQFKKEWLHTVSPEFFIHRDFPGRMLSESEFNSSIRPFSDVVRVDNLLRSVPFSKADSIDYMPNQPPGLQSNRNGVVMNNFRPTSIVPAKGSAKPFEDYIEYLIPDKMECDHLKRWVATLIAHPEIRMQWSVLLISETHGIGKTTLGERILMPLVGRHNTSFPGEVELSDSQFNTWCAHKRLVIVNEIYAGNSSKVYQRLKSVVADDETQINQKYVSPYRISNWCHVVASSNSLRALKLDNEDRRWFIPEVVETLRPQQYWMKFNQWLTDEGGLPLIMNWAIEYCKKNGPVRKGEHAPKSQTKDQVIVEGFSSGQMAAYELAQKIKAQVTGPKVKTTVVLDRDVVDFVRTNVHNGSVDRCEKALLIRNAFKAAGWTIGPKSGGSIDWNVPKYGARVMTLDPHTAETSMPNLAGSGIKPIDLSAYNTI